MSEEEEKGFSVKDKRIFSEEGEPKTQGSDAQSEKSDPEPDAKAEEAPPQGEPGPSSEEPQQDAGRGEPLPEINFSTFIISLSSSALYHLGMVPDPETGQPVTDLPLAKHSIDLLGMVQEKTKGNLDEDEEKLLEGVLYDLRMRYVQAVQGQPQNAE